MSETMQPNTNTFDFDTMIAQDRRELLNVLHQEISKLQEELENKHNDWLWQLHQVSKGLQLLSQTE